MDVVVLRLEPQQDLKVELDQAACRNDLEAACILTCIGSLAQATLRLAGQQDGTIYHSRFEIVSLVGTLSKYGSHYHIAIADQTGQTYGGHLLPGSLIYTTAEIVIGILPQYRFRRELDKTTGYRELVIDSHPAADDQLSGSSPL
jgi:predicted DNA-binding protein with PD1-like motif